MQIDDLNSQNISNEDQILSYEEIEKFPKSFYTHAEAIFHLKYFESLNHQFAYCRHVNRY